MRTYVNELVLLSTLASSALRTFICIVCVWGCNGFCVTLAIGENGSKIAYFSHSARCAPFAQYFPSPLPNSPLVLHTLPK